MDSLPTSRSDRADTQCSDRLAGLLSDTAARRLTEAFGHEPCLIPGAVNAGDLFDWERLRDLVGAHRHAAHLTDQRRNRSTGAFMRVGVLEVARQGTGVPPHHWTHPDDSVDAVRLNQLLRKGHSLLFRRVDEFDPAVGAMAAALEGALGVPALTVAFASWNDIPGIGLHLDAEDVVVVQIAGRKRWQVHEPTRTHPFGYHNDTMAEPPDTPPVLDVIVEPGDVLHVPSGWWHNVRPLGEPSLHLTFNLFRPTPLDVADELIANLADLPVCGEPIGATEAERADQLARLQAAVEALDSPTPSAVDTATGFGARRTPPLLPRTAL